MRALALAVVGVLVLAIVASNVILSTPLFDRITNGNKDVAWIQYERAWSWWPGRIHAKKLWLRVRDSSMEMMIRVDDARLSVSFVDLILHHRLHFSDVDSVGVSFRMRQRVASPAAPPEIVDALPPIPGADRIPFAPEKKIDLGDEWNDRSYHLWEIKLSNVVARDVREVWIDTVRHTGRGTYRGELTFKPLRRVEVGPIEIETHEGAVSIMNRPFVHDIEGTVRMSIAAFDPRAIRPEELLARLSGVAEGRAKSEDVSAFPKRFLAPIEIAGTLDVTHARVRIERGHVAPDTRVDAGSEGVRVDAVGHRWSGPISSRVEVTQRAGDRSPTATIVIDGHAVAAARVHPKPAPLARITRLRIDADAHETALWRLLTDLHASVAVGDAEIADARSLQGYLGEGAKVAFERGRVRFDAVADAWLREHRAGGEVWAKAEDLDVRIGSRVHVTGETALEGAFSDVRWAEDHASIFRARVSARAPALAVRAPRVRVTSRIDAHVRVDEWRSNVHGVPSADLRLEARGLEARLVEAATQPVVARADRVFVASHAEAFAFDASHLESARHRIVIERAEIPDLVNLDPLLPAHGVAFESGRARLSADVVIRPDAVRGKVQSVAGTAVLSLGGVRAWIGGTEVQGNATATVEAHAFDAQRRVLDLSGTKLSFDDIRVEGRTIRTTHWRGELDVVGGGVRIAGAPRLETFLQARADDAAPLLALALGDDLPKFLAGPARAPGLTGQAWLTLGDGEIALTDIAARGADVSVRGDYIDDRDRARAALIVAKGPLSAGISIDDRGTWVRVFGLEPWLRHRRSDMEEARSKARILR